MNMEPKKRSFQPNFSIDRKYFSHFRGTPNRKIYNEAVKYPYRVSNWKIRSTIECFFTKWNIRFARVENIPLLQFFSTRR